MHVAEILPGGHSWVGSAAVRNGLFAALHHPGCEGECHGLPGQGCWRALCDGGFPCVDSLVFNFLNGS